MTISGPLIVGFGLARHEAPGTPRTRAVVILRSRCGIVAPRISQIRVTIPGHDSDCLRSGGLRRGSRSRRLAGCVWRGAGGDGAVASDAGTPPDAGQPRRRRSWDPRGILGTKIRTLCIEIERPVWSTADQHGRQVASPTHHSDSGPSNLIASNRQDESTQPVQRQNYTSFLWMHNNNKGCPGTGIAYTVNRLTAHPD
jgi:hypothetical protein